MGIYLGATELSTGGGGGGGGFTKMNKYSTYRAVGGDTVNKLPPPSVSGITYGNIAAGETTFVWYDQSAGPYLRGNGVYNGWTFINNSTTYTVTSTVDNGSNQYTMVFSPALTAGINAFVPIVMLSDQFFTVNPATDLGLADGASIAYMLVGAGDTGTFSNSATASVYGGKGGYILQGTAIITTAATDLVLTPGIGASGSALSGGGSTIAGGLTLSSFQGSQTAGARGNAFSSQSLGIGAAAAGNGINGYGAGDGSYRGNAYSTSGIADADKHGFGMGASATGQSGDGAILLYY